MDDGQAGFAILWVPLIALPLALLVGGASAVHGRRSGRGVHPPP
jgi:hypothetical protein